MELALFRDNQFREHMGIVGSNYSVVSSKIGLKSSVMDVGNLVISSINA